MADHITVFVGRPKCRLMGNWFIMCYLWDGWNDISMYLQNRTTVQSKQPKQY